MATIEKYELPRQDKDGNPLKPETRYRVRYRTPDHRQTDKRGFTTKRDAEAFAATVEVDKLRGAYVSPAAGRVQLAEFAGEWLASKHKLSASTRARYQVVLDNFIAQRTHVALGDIKPELVDLWVAELVKARSAAATIHKTIGVLRQVLDFAVERGRIASNPVLQVELPEVAELEQRFITLDQLHALAAAADDHGPLVYVLGTCGLRFGEVAELRWRDVDLDASRLQVARSVTLVNNKFVVGKPKSKKARTVGLPEYVGDLLAARRGPADTLVFTDGQGGYMRGTNVRRRWWSDAVAAASLFPHTERNKAGQDVVVHDFKIHELRHTAASLAIQAGANIKALQNMLGHESAGLTLDRYGHLYPSEVDAVGVAINNLIAPGFTRKCGQNVGTDEKSGSGE